MGDNEARVKLAFAMVLENTATLAAACFVYWLSSSPWAFLILLNLGRGFRQRSE